MSYNLFMAKQYIDKLAIIKIRDRKLLVTLSKGKNTWYIPGGKREGNETDSKALTREVKEELQVDVIPETIKPCGVFEAQAHGKPPGTIVRMTCFTASFLGILTPSAEIERFDWFQYSQKHLCSTVDNLIFEDLKLKNLID